jgi:hypothetical protein
MELSKASIGVIAESFRQRMVSVINMVNRAVIFRLKLLWLRAMGVFFSSKHLRLKPSML